MQMFGEGSSGAGVGTTGLVPTRFVWPHGGRRVYLCGDFTRFFLEKFNLLFCFLESLSFFTYFSGEKKRLGVAPSSSFVQTASHCFQI
jgi:hypothetical protein